MKAFVRGLHACLQRRCDVNRYINYIVDCGHEVVPTAKESDIILLWACAFRKDYCDNSLAVIADYSRRFGEERVVVCGCLPAIDEALLKSQFKGRYFKWQDDSEALNAIFGNSNRDFRSTSRIIAEKNITNDIDLYRKEHPDEDVSYYDQFVKLFVSEGCRYDCAYCTEKRAFPEYKSFPLKDITNKCQRLVEASHQNKVVLIADSLGDYGKDFDSSLVELIDSILGIRDDTKVGLMNCHPTDFIANFDYLIGRLREERIFHLSIPIQSASDRILKLMNRPYTKDDLTRIFTELNNINFRECETHLLVGFPSESYDDFHESVDFVIRHKPKYVMASAYMESASLKSSNLHGKVSPETIRKRLQFLVEYMKEHEIICNYDSCEYIKEQFCREVKYDVR